MDPKANETAAEHGLSEVTTNEKSSTHYAQSQSGQEFHAQNKKAEARLTRKLDLIIMPLSVLLYLCSCFRCSFLATPMTREPQLRTWTVAILETPRSWACKQDLCTTRTRSTASA